MEGEKIKVLVVDDSALMRRLIPQLLTKDHEIEVVATAMDGLFALKKIAEFNPDVVTLDVDMPRMDGLTALRGIVSDYNTPVILVSSLTRDGADITIKALEMGAMDFVAKPQEAISLHIHEIADELIKKVKAVAKVPPRRLLPPPRRAPLKTPPRRGPSVRKVVAIGISTGGPNALTYLLPQLPEDLPAGVVVVQHMPPGFIEVFANRLDSISRIDVKEAKDGDTILPGRVLIAPGGRHMRVKRMNLGSIVILSGSPPLNGHRPSVDLLFSSVATEYGRDALGILMTGMGDDGVEGLGDIKRAGGMTIAQDEASSIVFGMPKVAIERGYAQRVVPLEDMATTIVDTVCGDGGEGGIWRVGLKGLPGSLLWMIPSLQGRIWRRW